jgi:hypothetical protein
MVGCVEVNAREEQEDDADAEADDNSDHLASDVILADNAAAAGAAALRDGADDLRDASAGTASKGSELDILVRLAGRRILWCGHVDGWWRRDRRVSHGVNGMILDR